MQSTFWTQLDKMDTSELPMNAERVVSPVRSAMAPLVSIIIPCYNQAAYLRAALESVQAQTVADWECIVVNDGSTDNSAIIASCFAAMDFRFRVLHQPNTGPSSARNRGLDEVRGRFVQFLDGDDFLAPDKLEKQLASVRVNERALVIICDFAYLNDKGEEYSNSFCSPRFNSAFALYDIAARWESELSVPIHAFLLDAYFFVDLGIRFDETLRNHEDWDCWMRIFSTQHVLHIVPEKLVLYRTIVGSNSRDLESNWRGFRTAVRKQRERAHCDPKLMDILGYKKRSIDYLYGKSFRRKIRRWIEYNGSFTRYCPWPLQRLIFSMLCPPAMPKF